MSEPVLSYELKEKLRYIKDTLLVIYPTNNITVHYLMLALLDAKYSNERINQWLTLNLPQNARNELNDLIVSNMSDMMPINDDVEPRFSDEYDVLASEISDNGKNIVNSVDMFKKIVSHNSVYTLFFNQYGLFSTIIDTQLQFTDTAMPPNKAKAKRKTNKSKETASETTIDGIRIIQDESNIVESSCVNMVRNASKGMYGDIIGCDDTVEEIFDVLTKYNRNTVALVGEHGIGKTSIIRRMAQLMYEQKCPKQFKDRYIMEFKDQISNLIINEMNRLDKYVAFIDDLDRLFINKESEANNLYVITELLNSPNISTIFIVSDSTYSKIIEPKSEISRLIHKININEPDDNTLFDILTSTTKSCSDHHNVEYSNDVIRESIRLAHRFFTKEKCPSSALDILDTTGAYAHNHRVKCDELIGMEKKLLEINEQMKSIGNSGSAEDYDKKDKLIREEIGVKQAIASLENSQGRYQITSDDIRTCVSKMINIPLSSMDDDDRDRLKSLNSNLNKVVIGQSEAINDVCRAVKRQRVGLSNPNKPCVMLFVGNSGTGKTFLAKRLSHEVFGDEKNIVRIDMSEYSEKTSVTKIYGSSPGYIGYEEGGVLTEAVKKNNRCVLLLDEIEKAHEDIFNVLLQVFDEGRLTDNKGTLVDFKNVIIIMTSNVGAKNVSEKTARIGFGKTDENEEDKEIILKSIKKTFKPEFINRIDNICYFNKLNDDNLRTIIKNEIKKVGDKVSELGFKLGDDIFDGPLVDSIFDKVKKESEYGARPVLREIQSQLEDKLTDYIIDNNIEDGFIFTLDTIYNK